MRMLHAMLSRIVRVRRARAFTSASMLRDDRMEQLPAWGKNRISGTRRAALTMPEQELDL